MRLRLPETSAIENKARDSVLRILLKGSTIIFGLFFVLLFCSFAIVGNAHILTRVVLSAVAFIYLVAVNFFFSNGKNRTASILITIFYLSVAFIAMWQWSVNIPFALIILCITITFSSILLGSRYALITATVIVLVLYVLQILTTVGVHRPYIGWQTSNPSKFGEVFGYSLLFAVLALVSWLFGRQIERSLRQARQAELALLEEKRLLAVRLKERTEKLRESQLEEMKQLYRFAELGQLSTALLHDLANQLNVLTLDIEDLEHNKHSKAVARAKESIKYLDEMVDKVRAQLKKSSEQKNFNCIPSILEVQKNLKSQLKIKNIFLDIQVPTGKPAIIRGDPIRFEQVVTILVNNAMDALQASPLKTNKKILIEVILRQKKIIISINDWGPGFSGKQKNQLFKPFHSTKNNGMGIGLFLSREILRGHFHGDLVLARKKNPTKFSMTIPLVD